MTSDLSQVLLEEAVGSWAPAVRYLEECDSTNRIAAEWAGEGAADGSIVITDHQTAGRGRLARSWSSVPGAGLQFSIVLRPQLASDSLGLLNLVAGSALAIAAAALGLPAKLKWPNDLILDGRKAAGILAETVPGSDEFASVILGIGVNVNHRAEDFPEELASSATSFRIASGKQFDRIEVLAAFLSEFGPRYSGLAWARTHEVIGEYRSLCDTIGRNVRVHLSDREIESRAVGVDDGGALLLESGERITAGDVIHLR
jgi:BirA family biotin operon repressor/biotin-[acetyl-CoA-carboxylase] ligase